MLGPKWTPPPVDPRKCSGQIANIKSIIESGGADRMITMDNSLMARIKDGSVEPKEAYMKAANKAAFARPFAISSIYHLNS